MSVNVHSLKQIPLFFWHRGVTVRVLAALAKPQKKKSLKTPPFQSENDNSWPPKPGRKKEINTDRPQVQIKAERKLDFFFLWHVSSFILVFL